MPFREVNSVRKLDDLTQEIRPRAEAFDDAGHLVPARRSAPVIVRSGDVALRFGILNNQDFWRRILPLS
jgi:hypothetical protein